MKGEINNICAKLCDELGYDGYDYNHLLKGIPNKNAIRINQCERLIEVWKHKLKTEPQAIIMIKSLKKTIKELKQ